MSGWNYLLERVCREGDEKLDMEKMMRISYEGSRWKENLWIGLKMHCQKVRGESHEDRRVC